MKFLFVLIFSTSLYATSSKYNQNRSVSFNEKQFLNLMHDFCSQPSNKKLTEENKFKDILGTYPKALVFLYFKKHHKNLCYLSASQLLKYLFNEFKKQTEQLSIKIVNNCLVKNRNSFLCKELKTESSLYDLAVILGGHCTSNTHQAFKHINCALKEVMDKKCKLYKSSNDPLNTCPEFILNQNTVRDLHRVYKNKNCTLRNWKAPKC